MLCPPTHIVTSWTFCPPQSGLPLILVPVLKHGGLLSVGERLWAEFTPLYSHCTRHSRCLLTSIVRFAGMRWLAAASGRITR